MRKSEQSHSLVTLRGIMGVTQPELAALVRCSPSTIAQVELGIMDLSEALAGKVASATGINAKWLLRNNLDWGPVDNNGRPYTKERFEEWRSNIEIPDDGADAATLGLMTMTTAINYTAAIMREAHQQKKTKVYSHKIITALMEISMDLHSGSKSSIFMPLLDRGEFDFDKVLRPFVEEFSTKRKRKKH